jgi:hypothetical protein
MPKSGLDVVLTVAWPYSVAGLSIAASLAALHEAFVRALSPATWTSSWADITFLDCLTRDRSWHNYRGWVQEIVCGRPCNVRVGFSFSPFCVAAQSCRATTGGLERQNKYDSNEGQALDSDWEMVGMQA